MTVWIVTWYNPGPDHGIEAVFDSRETAKNFIKEIKKTEKYSWFKLKEWEVQ